MADNVKMGIEIEYLIMTKEGKPVQSGWGSDNQKILGLKILSTAAESIEPGIKRQSDRFGHKNIYQFKDGSMMMPDTFTLLETVTSPSKNLKILRNQLFTMKNALIKSAEKYGCLVSGAACPIGYAYNDLQTSANTLCNNAGMHIHLEAPGDREKKKIANFFTQIIPELVILSANSPIYNTQQSQFASKRLSTSPLVGAENLEVHKYDPDNPIQFDSKKRYQFVTMHTKKKVTVELRGFDAPMNIDWAMAIAAVVQCYAAKGTKMFISKQRDTVMSNSKSLRGSNYNDAVKKGINALLKPDKTTHMTFTKDSGKPSLNISFLYHNKSVDENKKVAAALAVKRLLYYVEAEAYELGLTGFLQPLYDAIRSEKNQSAIQTEWFQKLGYKKYFDKLAAESAKLPVNKQFKKGVSRKYFIARQKLKSASKEKIYLTAEGLKSAGLKEGDSTTVSGPLGSIKIEVALEKNSSDSLPLTKEEVRISLGCRNQIGISLYDPIIIAQEKAIPLIITKTDSKWAFTPEISAGSQNLFRIQKGIEKYKDYVVINKKDALSIGVVSGDDLCVTGDSGHKGQFLVKVSQQKVLPGNVAMMKKDRESIGESLGNLIKLSKGASRFFTVYKGLTEHKDFIVINEKDAKSLGVVSGDRLSVISIEENKQRFLVKTVKSLKPGVVAMMKKDRDAISVNLGDSVKLKPVLSPAFKKLLVKSGDKDDLNASPPVVRITESVMRELGLNSGDGVLISKLPDKKKNALSVIVKKENRGRDSGKVALTKTLRDELGVNIGDTVILFVAE